MGDAGLPPLQPLPTTNISEVAQGIYLLEPLSRLGHGPGMIILTSGEDTIDTAITITDFVPTALMKWAEEGYAVVQIQPSATKGGSNVLQQAIGALEGCAKYDQGNVGIVAYDAALWNQLELDVSSFTKIKGAVIYTSAEQGLAQSSVPCVQHLYGKSTAKLPRTKSLTAYSYPTSKSQAFALPNCPDFDYALEAVSHTRNLTFFKRHDIIAGPIFDLEEIWDEHTYYEFENRSVAHTMATMVQEPYVNHVPTLTGGIGRKDLTEFYTNHFVFSNPADTELELISRTVGIDRVVDEFIYKFTHDRTVDWLMPGVPPTNIYVEVPMMAVVNIRGDRLYHEHISWDSGTVMRQIGMLPEYLPWTASEPEKEFFDGSKNSSGTGDGQMEVRVPVAGTDTANKMREKNSVTSNQMFSYRMRRV